MEAEAKQIEINNKYFSLDEKIEIYEETLQKCSFDPETELPKIPLLTKNEEIEFAQKIEEGNERYKDYFLLANLRFVAKKANDYYQVTSKKHNLEKRDLFQYGTIGLMKAIEKFDYKKGNRFTTYAGWWINSHISRAIVEKGHAIRKPVPFAEKLASFRKQSELLYKESFQEPSIIKIANRMGISVKEANFLKDKEKENIISLDKPIHSEHDSQFWQDKIEDTVFDNPEKVALRKAYQKEIRETVEKLNPEEKHIIKERFGFNGNVGKSLEEIGKEFGLTRERIRQKEEQILEKIKITLIQQEPLMIKEVLEKFPEKEKNLLEVIFNLRKKNSMTNKKIGEIFGLSANEVKKLERKSLKEIVGHYVKDMS
jgi:RNA polymerase sigma factor (sigma-70 family)